MKKWLPRALFILLLAALLSWALRNAPLPEILASLRRLTLAQIAWLLALNSGIFLLITARWWLILRAESQRVPFLPLIGYRLAAFGMSYFTPGPQVGGEPLQILYLQKRCGLTFARAMQHKAAAPGLSAIVTFHSSLDNAPLVEKLSNAHVLAVPSSYEGFGIVYLEGMAFGLPAIGTTAGAAGEIIRDGETGFLIRPDDAPTLAARLEHLAADRALLTRLSLHALERYRQQPQWEQTAGQIRQFLLEMIKQGGK